MKNFKILLTLFISLLLLVSCSGASSGSNDSDSSSASDSVSDSVTDSDTDSEELKIERVMTVSESLSSGITLNAIVTTPTDFDPKTESLPMIVFLHGAGERGDDLELVKTHGIANYFTKNSDYKDLRVITVSPQCPANLVWDNISPSVFEFVQKMVAKFNAAENKISLTGISMGGFGTWDLLCAYPDYFAAAVPICGGGMSWRVNKSLVTPIKAYHGDLDPTVPYERSEEMCRAVEKAGGTVEFTLLEGEDHFCWDTAYKDEKAILWLAAAEK